MTFHHIWSNHQAKHVCFLQHLWVPVLFYLYIKLFLDGNPKHFWPNTTKSGRCKIFVLSGIPAKMYLVCNKNRFCNWCLGFDRPIGWFLNSPNITVFFLFCGVYFMWSYKIMHNMWKTELLCCILTKLKLVNNVVPHGIIFKQKLFFIPGL